jgi:hypothetical protein
MPELHERHSQAICGRSGAVDERKISLPRRPTNSTRSRWISAGTRTSASCTRSGRSSRSQRRDEPDHDRGYYQRVQRVAWTGNAVLPRLVIGAMEVDVARSRRNASDHPRLTSRTYEARFECRRRVAFGNASSESASPPDRGGWRSWASPFASRIEPTVADRRPARPRVSEAARHDKIVDTFDSSGPRRPDCNIPDSERSSTCAPTCADLLA